jgi:rhodanese-related sulfurtransferase
MRTESKDTRRVPFGVYSIRQRGHTVPGVDLDHRSTFVHLRQPPPVGSRHRSGSAQLNGMWSCVRYCDPMSQSDRPADIRQISAQELKAMLDAREPLELIDVRTPQEQAIAAIASARLLDKTYHDALLALDRATPLVFQCHHGIRSQHAAEYFRDRGFTRLYNLVGGIDAWSMLVDPAVPRY